MTVLCVMQCLNLQVSDAHLGSALCCLLDDKYGHLQLQETPTCQAARQFLDTRRDTEVDRARQEEAGAVENLLGHYHQSFVSGGSAHVISKCDVA